MQVWTRTSCHPYDLCPLMTFCFTQHRGLVVSTPPSYSGGLGFNSRHEDRRSFSGYSWIFSVPPGRCRNSVLNNATSGSFYIRYNFLFIDHPAVRRYNW
jgi:hypothetical protein